ncbi:MAG: TonB C-terminal domain-containing protein [Nitrospinota bacterium]|nr:TonB C-terminal domain-containing protein [Nitrospinota bacterium]
MRRDDPEPKTRWGPMALASVAIHALVIGGAVILASGSAPPRLLYAPSMSVGLVGPGKVGLPPGGGGPPVPPNTDGPREKSAPKTKVKAPDPPPTKRRPAKETPAESPRPKVERPKPEITRTLTLKPKPKTAKPPKAVVRVPKKKTLRKRPPPKKRAAAPRGDAPPKQAKKKHRKKPSAVSAKTRRKPAVRKPAGKDLDALERIRKRLLARASRPAGRRGETGTKRRGGGPGKPGGGGFSGPGGRDSYKNELARIFYAAWVLPRSIPTEGLKVDLIIHIDRDGRIVKTDIKSPSGNRLFDESVLRAVAKVDTAGGLPPLPPEIPESLLVQGFRFDPKYHRGFIP